MVEIKWLPMSGFESLFFISNHGQVRSLRTGRLIKTQVNPQGYLQFATRIGGRKGKAQAIKIHRKVAETFIDAAIDGKEVNHIDGVKTNNHANNLEWVTHSENIIHARSLGLIPSPIQSSQRMFDESTIRDIRSLYRPRNRTCGARALAKKFNTTHVVILAIVKYQTYKEVK